ncbi:MAG: hydantoinase B/oxoprolinase family protein, partial [Pseudomonadota bacterium]
GDPLERDPELVRYDAREEYISVEAAGNVYGVVLNTCPELYEVNYEATGKLRQELKKKKEKGIGSG